MVRPCKQKVRSCTLMSLNWTSFVKLLIVFGEYIELSGLNCSAYNDSICFSCHIFVIYCSRLKSFRDIYLNFCFEQVTYSPICGHTIPVDCFLKQKYDKNEQVFVCPKTVDVHLPRCGHEAKVPCETALRLLVWSGDSATHKDQNGEGDFHVFVLFMSS